MLLSMSIFDYIPNPFQTDSKILMDNNIPHTGNLFPWNIRISISKMIIYILYRFTNNFQSSQNRILNLTAFIKIILCKRANVIFYCQDTFPNIMKIEFYIPFHKIETSSLNICFFIRGLMAEYSTKSTFLPMASSISNLIPTKSRRLISALPISTNISISLSSLASPLTKEPKTPALLISYRFSIGRILFLISSIFIFYLQHYLIILLYPCRLLRRLWRRLFSAARKDSKE